jgi:hypothetical protein
MKNILLIILSICLLEAACKKESKPKPTPTKPVEHNPPPVPPVKLYASTWHLVLLKDPTDNISVNNNKALFSIPNASSAPDTLTLEQAGITNYYFIAYDTAAREISRIHRYANSPGTEIRYINKGIYTAQHSQLVNTPTTSNFDTVTDSLPDRAAISWIFVIAAASEISINTANESQIIYQRLPLHNFVSFFNYSEGPGISPYPNTSNTYMGFTGLNSSRNVILAMSRIVAQLQVNIPGTIPANADHFKFMLYGENQGAGIDGYMLPVGKTDPLLTTNIPITSADKAKLNYQYSQFIINTQSPVSLVISCYDASNKVIAYRTVNNLQFRKMMKIVLTGQLFNNNTVGGPIVVDPTYGDSTVVHF